MKKYAPLLVFAFFFALYALTAQHGLSWQDSGEYQWRVLSADVAGFSGLARAHPLYISAARLWSGCFPPAFRLWAVSAFSGMGAAVALAVLFAALRRLTSSFAAASIAVVLAGFSHMLWWLSCVAEVYTWSLAAMALELFLLMLVFEGGRGRKRAACTLFFVNGLHLGIHNFALIDLAVLVPAATVALYRSERAFLPVLKAMAAGIVIWFVGAMPMVSLFVRCLNSGTPLVDAVRSLLFGAGYEQAVMGTAGVEKGRFAINMALAALSFASPLWMGIFSPCREGACVLRGGMRHFVGSVTVLAILHFLFWIRYFVPDQATFVLPTLFLGAFFVGLGFARSGVGKWRAVQLIALGMLTAVFVPLIAAQALEIDAFGIRRARALPFRSEFSYWLQPWKCDEDSAERFAAKAAETVKAGDVLIADTTVSGMLQAAVLTGKFPSGCKIVPVYSYRTGPALPGLLQNHGNVYLVSPVEGYTPDDKEFLSGRYRYVKKGVLFRIAATSRGDDREERR